MPLTFTDHRDGFAIICASGAGSLTGASIDANGIPHKFFKKALVRTGEWQMSNGNKFTLTAADLEHFAAQFGRMNAADVAVPLHPAHITDPVQAAKETAGYLRGAFVEGDTLYGQVELIGDAAIAMASSLDVSIFVPASITDGKGVTYDRAIAHVALTPTPVVTGLGEFVPIAASRGQVNVPVLRLSQGVSMDLKKFAALIGVPAEGDDATLTAAIEAKCKALTAPPVPAPEVAQLSLARKELDTVKGELAALKNPAKPDAQLVKLARKNRELELARLVDTGKITPDVRGKIAALFVDGDALALSLNPTDDARFDALILALAENDAVKLGSQVKVIEASRTTPGDKTSMTDAEINELSDRLAGVAKK